MPNVGWSTEEDRKLARMWLADEPPRTVREIADELEKSKSAVDRRIAALDLRGHKGDRRKYEELTGVALEPAIRPVRISLPPSPKRRSTPTEYSTLVWTDVHYPFHDNDAVSIVRQVAADLKPYRLVCMGDVFDFAELSDHRPPKDEMPDFQETINAGTRHLADIRAISGAEEAIFLGGNHEDRWDRMLVQARRDPRFRQLLKLPKIKRALDFEEVIGFEELGYEYRPYTEATAYLENETLLYTHGDKANKHVAAGMLRKYGKNVMFGHMHRIQNFTSRDLKGQEAGWCIGCLCTLDPHYSIFADWHQGFAVVNWQKVRGEWFFSVEQIRIHDGVAIWRDKVYTSEEE